MGQTASILSWRTPGRTGPVPCFPFGLTALLLRLTRTAAPLAAIGAIFIAVPASAACMQGTLQDVETLQAKDRGKSFEVLVAEEDVEVLRQHGFVVSECSAGLRTPEGQAAARDAFCEQTYSGNEAVQEQMRRIFGVHPALLCRTAELVSGSWNGRKIDFSEDDLRLSAAPGG